MNWAAGPDHHPRSTVAGGPEEWPGFLPLFQVVHSYGL